MNTEFKERIFKLMKQVPAGRVVTYGDIAGLAGQANAARVVGGIAHYGDSSLPWHRLVNRFGGLAAGFPGGREVQARLLEAEGVECLDGVVQDFDQKRCQLEDFSKAGE